MVQGQGVEMTIFEEYYKALCKHIKFPKTVTTFKNHEELKASRADFMITLGGDGTILDTPMLIRDMDLPLAGVNLGRLGFLVKASKKIK